MNTRLAVATHILTYIATEGGRPTTSEAIAASVDTNPALIRRLLQQLGRAGLTRSQMGTGGGALLARPEGQITLLDVYRAIGEDGGVFALHEHPNPRCPVGRHITGVLESRISAAERAMEAELQRTTIADMVGDISALNRKTV